MSFTGPLEDRLAIRELIGSYDDAIARFDAQAWGETWAEDAVWEMMGNVLTGREAIVAFWQKTMSQFEFVVFRSSPGAVAIDGVRATGRVYAQEMLQAKGSDALHMHGRYDDHYVKIGDAWRFAHRVYHVLGQHR